MYTGNAWANAQQQPGFANAYSQQRGGNQASPNFNPAMLIGPAMTIGGAALGAANQKKALSADEINQMFGAPALAGNTQDLFRMLMQSPAFQSIMQGGAQQGSMMQGRIGQALGKSGLSGAPMGGMMKAASMGYGSQLQNQGKQQLFMQALQTAMQNMQGQMSMFNQQQQMPNFWSQMGGALMGGGAQGMMGIK